MSFSFEFIHLQICTRYNLFVHQKKSYQLLICRVAKNLPLLELLNHFIKSSIVAYKRVAYKKNLVYLCHLVYASIIERWCLKIGTLRKREFFRYKETWAFLISSCIKNGKWDVFTIILSSETKITVKKLKLKIKKLKKNLKNLKI